MKDIHIWDQYYLSEVIDGLGNKRIVFLRKYKSLFLRKPKQSFDKWYTYTKTQILDFLKSSGTQYLTFDITLDDCFCDHYTRLYKNDNGTLFVRGENNAYSKWTEQLQITAKDLIKQINSGG